MDVYVVFPCMVKKKPSRPIHCAEYDTVLFMQSIRHEWVFFLMLSLSKTQIWYTLPSQIPSSTVDFHAHDFFS